MDINSLEKIISLTSDRHSLFAQKTKSALVEIFPQEQMHCIEPFNLSEDKSSDLFRNSPVPHLFDKIHKAESVTFSVLSNITLASPHSLLFNPDRSLIGESYHNADMVQIPLREIQTLLDQGLVEIEPSRIVEEPALLLMGPWSWIYHHWLLECLSRLWALDEFPELQEMPIIVPPDLAPFQIETLNALGVTEDQLLPFDGSNWLFKKLYLPSFLAPGGHSKRQVDWLRHKLFEAFKFDPLVGGSRRLYISRQDANARRVVNENEVVAYLEALDFETIRPGDITVAEQAILFSQANIIVAPHGAGLTNLIFAQEEVGVMELMPDSFVNRCYWYLANTRSATYGFVMGKTETENHDYRIEIEKLDKALSSLLSI